MNKEELKKLLLDMFSDYRQQDMERDPKELSLRKMEEKLANDWAEEIMHRSEH